MLQFDKALKIVLQSARTFARERVQLTHAVGRVLAQDVRTDVDMPPHNMSFMDGFACRSEDLAGLPLLLRVVETIAAGAMPRRKIGPGQCARIMTGAPVPGGADVVVMIEHTTPKDGMIQIDKRSANTNIRYKREDLAKGEIVLRRGTLITPAQIAVLASVGCSSPWVASVPVVGVIATGDELVEPDRKPAGAQIRNSNGWQLCAQVERAGCKARYLGIAKDTPGAVDRILKKALVRCDVILLSGGVSAGDFDYVPDILRKNDIKLLFEKIAIKPGKPTVFGIKNKNYFFGLPGNPVATFVLFEMLVRPFLYLLRGHITGRVVLKAQLGEHITCKGADRVEFRPVRFGADGQVYAIDYHGSAHIHAYTQAQGIITIPAGATLLECKSVVDVVML